MLVSEQRIACDTDNEILPPSPPQISHDVQSGHDRHLVVQEHHRIAGLVSRFGYIAGEQAAATRVLGGWRRSAVGVEDQVQRNLAVFGRVDFAAQPGEHPGHELAC